MEMAKITEYNLLDCVIRFGGVKKSTIFFGSLWFAGAEAYIRESISNRGEIMSELSFSHLFFAFPHSFSRTTTKSMQRSD